MLLQGIRRSVTGWNAGEIMYMFVRGWLYWRVACGLCAGERSKWRMTTTTMNWVALSQRRCRTRSVIGWHRRSPGRLPPQHQSAYPATVNLASAASPTQYAPAFSSTGKSGGQITIRHLNLSCFLTVMLLVFELDFELVKIVPFGSPSDVMKPFARRWI